MLLKEMCKGGCKTWQAALDKSNVNLGNTKEFLEKVILTQLGNIAYSMFSFIRLR